MAEKKVSTFNRAERVGAIERTQRELPLSSQAELLALNRSSLYYQPKPVSAREVALKHRIDEIYTESPFYGSRRIRAQLLLEGWSLSRENVQKQMREMGLEAIYPKPNLSLRNQEHKIYPYLLRGLKIEEPNLVWGIDITYLRLRSGWMYLVAIIDWYSRYVVSWEISQTLEIDFVLSAVKAAFLVKPPRIVNSDQGSHFTSSQYTQLIIEAGAKVSLDGKGRALDNIFTERLWRTVKYENIFLMDYASPREARTGLRDYFDFYNHRRLHQSLDYATPAYFYHGHGFLSK